MMWIERHRLILDLALSGLRRQRFRPFIFTGFYTLLVFALASLLFFTRALRSEAEILLKNGPEIMVQRIVAGRHALIPARYAEPIRAIRGVQSAVPRLWGYYFHAVNGSNYTLMTIPDFPHADHQIEVGETVLDSWGAVRKNALFFTTHDRRGILLEAVNTFPHSSALLTADMILMSQSAFRSITGIPKGYATDLALSVRNEGEARTIAQKIMRIFPDARPVLRSDLLRTYASVFDWRSGLSFILTGAVLAAFLMLAWDRAGGLTSEERREIGVLKAVGWDISDILALKLWEGAIISITAYLSGCIAAYLHVFIWDAPLFSSALRGWSVLYPQFHLPPHIHPMDLLAIFFITVVPYTCVILIPAWRWAAIEPDRAMRNG